MTDVSALQTNKKRRAGVVAPYARFTVLAVGAAISRPPMTGLHPIGG